jgi:hypothetical protein
MEATGRDALFAAYTAGRRLAHPIREWGRPIHRARFDSAGLMKFDK